MPASFRVLLSCGSSRGRVLLRLLSSLLPGGGFGGGALLRLLGRGGLLPGGGFGGRALLRLLGRGGLLPGGGFGGGALLRLLGSGNLLPGGGFGGRALLRCMVRRRCWSHPRLRRRWCMGDRRRRANSRSSRMRIASKQGFSFPGSGSVPAHVAAQRRKRTMPRTP
jgi:hypothetical protein